MSSLSRGVVLSSAAAVVGVITLVCPPTALPSTGLGFWRFLTYVWFGVAAALLLTSLVVGITRIGMGVPLAIALLVGGPVSLQTAILAYRTSGLIAAGAAGLWLLLFLVFGGVEAWRRSQLIQS